MAAEAVRSAMTAEQGEPCASAGLDRFASAIFWPYLPAHVPHSRACPGSAYKASTAESSRNTDRLKKMFAVSDENFSRENTLCADCGNPIEHRNAWASINLGIFCCIQCSGIHRQMGVHISKVRAVAADDWNDDWVETMIKWGNARAAGFWELKVPLERPGNKKVDGKDVASRGMIDFIRAKYQARLFAADGEPNAWHEYLALGNGWVRHYDASSKHWFYARGEETVWEPPADAALPRPPPTAWWAGHEGWLEKKSGGKDGVVKAKMLQKWDRRFFVLVACGTSISYYKSDEAFRKKEAPAGTVSLAGSAGFLKEVKGGVHRFTVQSPERELKLRAPETDFASWSAALKPVIGSFKEGRPDDD
jgi:hypothetical protein